MIRVSTSQLLPRPAMRTSFAVFCVSLSLLGCASAPGKPSAVSPASPASPPQDTYDAVKRLYVNQGIGFSLEFPQSWLVFEAEEKMPPQAQNYARKIRESGGEMIFVAQNRASTMYLRGIAEETALEPDAYFNIIQEVNRKELLESDHETTEIAGEKAIRWTYEAEAGGTRIKFLEYQVRRDRYNVRLSFWTLPSLYASYEKEFEGMMKTYLVLGAGRAQASFTETVVFRDGRVMRGVKTAVSSESLMVVTSSGESFVFPKSQILRVER